MNKFHFFLACAGLCIAIMAVISNELQSFAPGAILFASVLMNAIKTQRSTIATYALTAIVSIFLLNIVWENFVHFGHMTDPGIKFLFSAVLAILFGILPLMLRKYEYNQNNICIPN